MAAALVDTADILILDSGQGGTGTKFDWSAIPESVKSKALLAGGLNADNIPNALRTGTAGLDMNSGLERGGRKDPAVIAQAFSLIRHFTY